MFVLFAFKETNASSAIYYKSNEGGVENFSCRWLSSTWIIPASSIIAAKIVDGPKIGWADGSNGEPNRQRSRPQHGLLQIIQVYYTQIRLKRLQWDKSEPESLMGEGALTHVPTVNPKALCSWLSLRHKLRCLLSPCKCWSTSRFKRVASESFLNGVAAPLSFSV